MFRKIGVLALFLFSTTLFAQSPRSAVGGEATLWAGGEMSTFNPDWGCTSNSPFACSHQLIGPTVFFDFNLRPRWGVEGEARWLHWHGSGGESEANYFGGPRYRFIQYHRLDGWAKVLLGGGWITTPNYPQAGSLKGSYFAYAPGATAEYHLTHKIALRGDYEYEVWPSFAGPPTYNSSNVLVYHNSGLTPNGFSVGISYKFRGQ